MLLILVVFVKFYDNKTQAAVPAAAKRGALLFRPLLILR